MLTGLLLFTQQPPDSRSKMNERLLIHDFLNAFVPVPVLRSAYCGDIDNLPNAAGPACQHDHSVGQVHGFIDGVRDE